MDAEKLTNAITKALAYTENGGKVNLSKLKAGGSGELKSIFQFLPETWKRDAKAITGNPDLPISPETEAVVVHGKVSQWVQKGLDAGKNPEDIAKEIGSEWNSGNPNAYKEGLKGTNKHGVAYDTPAYANKVANYTKEFLGDKGSNGDSVASNSQESNQDSNPQLQEALKSHNEALNNLASIAAEAKANSVKPIAANAPLPQNNNLQKGVLPTAPTSNPGMLS